MCIRDRFQGPYAGAGKTKIFLRNEYSLGDCVFPAWMVQGAPPELPTPCTNGALVLATQKLETTFTFKYKWQGKSHSEDVAVTVRFESFHGLVWFDWFVVVCYV